MIMTKPAYEPSHPWYYKLGNPALSPEEVKPLSGVGCKLPKANLTAWLESAKASLDKDIETYLSYVGEYEASEGETDLDLCVSLSLKHNHISYNKALLYQAEDQLGASMKQLQLEL